MPSRRKGLETGAVERETRAPDFATSRPSTYDRVTEGVTLMSSIELFQSEYISTDQTNDFACLCRTAAKTTSRLTGRTLSRGRGPIRCWSHNWHRGFGGRDDRMC